MGGMAVVETNPWPIGDPLSTAESEFVYKRWPELRTECPTCRNTGSYKHRGHTYSCDCTQQRKLAKRYTLAGIGVDFQRLDWEDYFQDKRPVQEISRWLNSWRDYVDRGVGIILTGGHGTGKTMLANLVLKELVKHGVRCYATTFADTVEEFTKSWGNQEQKQWFEDTFKLTKVLLLDDLGREFKSSNNLAPTTFDSILRTRVQNARPTIVTTNIPAEDLDVAGYGAGVLSLLKRSCVKVEVNGADFGLRYQQRTQEEIAAGERRPIV